MRPDPIPAFKRQLGDELARQLAGARAADVAALLHTEGARISDLRLGKLDRFSLETLVRYLHRLRFRVAVSVESERFGARAPSERRGQGPGAGG